MSCSSCKYLKSNDKIEGNVSGCKYYCKKCKGYVLGNNLCDKFEKDYCRRNFECDLIYLDGKNYYDEKHSISFYIFVLIILILMIIFTR